MEKYDVIVIGAGPGGYPAAIRAAQLGARTAIVEKELPGGTCLNWGCIPTKTLIASSEVAARVAHAADFGVKAGPAVVDYPAMIRRKNGVVEKLRSGVASLLKANGVTWLQGAASFAARNRIGVKNDGAETQYEASNIIIATGSVSAVPGFLPRHPRVVESRAFLDRTELPGSMIVLGGGVIGCEFACLCARLGVKVTVVEMLEDILVMLDADIRRELRRSMEEQLKIRVLTGKPLAEIVADDSGVTGKFGDETLRADLLLAAIGRKPFTAGLALEAAGVTTDKAGYIEVDACGQTKAASVYAIGDVNGGPQLAHAATAQGIAVVEAALKKGRRPFDTLVPACIFTVPEIGAVGLTENQAKEKQIAVKTGKFSFAALGKAMAMGETGGFVKWVADAATDRLLGAHAVGPHATELIAEAVLAIKAEYTAAELGKVIHSHPTLSETWMEAAHALHGVCIHAPPRRR